MGAKIGQKMISFKPGFQHPLSISNIKETHWWGSGGKKSYDRLVVRAHVRYLCQNRPKTEAQHPPGPPKASISPQSSSVA